MLCGHNIEMVQDRVVYLFVAVVWPVFLLCINQNNTVYLLWKTTTFIATKLKSAVLHDELAKVLRLIWKAHLRRLKKVMFRVLFFSKERPGTVQVEL